MISEIVNTSTGPVGISREVQLALAKPAISHRSAEFMKLYAKTTEFLSSEFNVHHTFLLTGSGTLANEAMIWQIKILGGKGLILSNGEFGLRLVEQAKRNSLSFSQYETLWGVRFEIKEIESLISTNQINWLLFCHCETSTGVINDLKQLTEMASRHNVLCFIDCMSTVGTMPLDLSGVAMATASSGKGLASVPGLAIVFSNIDPVSGKDIPSYLDLSQYSEKSSVPFTISSNLVKALYTSIRQKLTPHQFELIDIYGKIFFRILSDRNLTPFSNQHSKVFTIVTPTKTNRRFIRHMKSRQVLLSHESEYLKKRDWCQLAIFGYYRKTHLDLVSNALQHCAFVNE